ncbi:MAG: ABC transporter ATP-binding protein [Acidimicrobiales bacterium]
MSAESPRSDEAVSAELPRSRDTPAPAAAPRGPNPASSKSPATTQPTAPCTAAPLFRAELLRVTFPGRTGPLPAVAGASLEVRSGEVLGLVGESGSGKSLTCRSTIALMPPRARMTATELSFEGVDLFALRPRALRKHRAHHVGMIVQDPFSCLDPTMRVGEQIAETLRANVGLGRTAARARAIELLGTVDIADPERRFFAYPHEFSGGMRQRIAIAIAVSCQPKLLVADEPTTALDVTTQAQILTLLRRLKDETGMAILIVSHDFGVIAQICDRVAVMYGGFVVETGTLADVYTSPMHPYTEALLAAIPSIESAGKRTRRTGIPGQPPGLGDILSGCPFVPRCSMAEPSCSSIDMVLEPVAPDHVTACPVVVRSVLGDSARAMTTSPLPHNSPAGPAAPRAGVTNSSRSLAEP